MKAIALGILLLVVCFFGDQLAAQNQEVDAWALPAFSDIVTDRPDATESALSVPKGAFQLETGSYLTIYPIVDEFTMSSNLFRYGIANRLELRLVSELKIQHFGGVFNVTEVGISDIEVGLKYNLIDGPIHLGLLGHLSIPTGSNGFSSNTYEFHGRALAAHAVTDWMGFSYNLGYSYFGKKYIEWETEAALVYTYSIGFALAPRIGFFSEIYGEWEDFTDWTATYDNGFTYLLNPNLQFDFSFGTSLTQELNFYSGGLSWRILPKPLATLP